MHSTFMGIEIGKRSINAHSQGLATIGHNLENASTEGYSRQKVTLVPFEPLYAPHLNRPEAPGQIGQGVTPASVKRIRDELLDQRILAQGNHVGFWKSRHEYLLMVEQTYNEPTDSSVRALLDRFWDGWQELALSPETLAPRQAVAQRGRALMEGINHRYSRLRGIQTMLNDDLAVSVGEVNQLLSNIASLNEQIEKSEAMGDNPNDLLDRRDLLVENLSHYIDVTVDRRDPDEFLVHTKGVHLVQGTLVSPLRLEGNPQNEGYLDIYWERSGERLLPSTGKLGALLRLRDGDVRKEVKKLDMMTLDLVDATNQIHQRAYSAGGQTGVPFFEEYPVVTNAVGNYDLDGDGAFDHSFISRITGSRKLDPGQQIGIEGTITLSGEEGMVLIPYASTDTVAQVIDRINHSGAEVKAALNQEGHLVLKGGMAEDLLNPDFVIRYVADSSYFLAGYAGVLNASGAEGAFNWEQANAVEVLEGGPGGYAVAPLAHPSGWLRVHERILGDPSVIASGFGEHGRPAESGDGSAALAIAQIRTRRVMIGQHETFDDYFAAAVADIGLAGEVAGQTNASQALILEDLKTLQSSVSGVNIDEEVAEMIKFQHGYNAGARFVTEVDKMLETLINKMGV